MRLLVLFKKTMIENFRDWKVMILTLTFAPFFVFLMYFYMQQAPSTYQIIIINHDRGINILNNYFNAGDELITTLTNVKDPKGINVLHVNQLTNINLAKKQLRARTADLVVEIPEQFSQVLMDYKQGQQPLPAVIKTYGDSSNARYMMAQAWCDAMAYTYSITLTGQKGPLELQPQTIGGTKSLNEFELYVPALLVLSLIMLMFTAAASLIKEKDKGTIIRLRISSITTFEWLASVSLAQIIIGMLAMGLTYLTAVAVGYHASGSLFNVMVVGLLSSLSVVANSLVVAALLRTIFDLLTIGCFPFFILMFFSGGMIPLPPLHLFTIAGRSISANDFLPTTHTGTALSKILNHNAGLSNIAFELCAISILTVILFLFGTWLFTKRHMPTSV